jgi:hypothetical protein
VNRADVVPLDDLSPADWLREQLVDFGGRVREVVPTTGYDAVARVLHCHEQVPGDSGRWSEVAEHCGTTLHPLAQFRMLAGLDRRSVATKAWVDGVEPGEGSLDRVSLAALRGVLAAHTDTPDRCWFALWEGWGGLPDAWRAAPTFALPGRNHHLFAGRLRDVVEISVEFECAGMAAGGQGAAWLSLATGTGEPEQPRDWAEVSDRFRTAGRLQSPNLWWPEDRAWCVASEIDFDSTLVAGTAALVAELAAHPDLEAFEVGSGDSLQIDGDPVNMR